MGALRAEDRLTSVSSAVPPVRDGGGVLLISDIDALLPFPAEPVATLILTELRTAVATGGVAFVATSAVPDNVDPRLRAPDLCDRELGLSLPDGAIRKQLLEVLLRDVPAGELDLDEIAERTPGFVVADLAALVREAALRAAARASADGKSPALTQEDLTGALSVIRPLSRSASEEVSVGSVTLEDVGDMAETKQALTEAVLWPLQHPETFERLGVEPPRGVLLYGPPGCGKTFVVRALASSGRLSVHAVKGAELMDKWVGASEKAVRDLFRRARDSAPSLIFLDELDALAPRRGQSFDSGVTDRVVAALLTELDGIEPLRNVVVLGATNRPDLIDPALLRPGRLEKLVFVEPPDTEARREILRTAGKSVPLADDVDLDALAEQLDGYSAADCVALLRESALTAMRRSIDAADVTADDVAKARETVRPSLDPVQVEALRLQRVLRTPRCTLGSRAAAAEHEVERGLGRPPETRETAAVDHDFAQSRFTRLSTERRAVTRQGDGHAYLGRRAVHHAANGIQVVGHAVVGERFHEHHGAVVADRFAGVPRHADRIGHVVQAVEERDEVELPCPCSRRRRRLRIARSQHPRL